MSSLFIGFSAGIVTPIRVGEYLGRKIVFEDVSLVKVTVSTIIDKFASLFMILIIGGFTAIYFLIVYYSFLYSIPIILYTLFLVGIIFFILKGYLFTSKLFNSFADKYEFVNKIRWELTYVKELSSLALQKLFLYSFFHYAIIIIQYTILALAFEPNGDVFNFVVAAIIILFVKSILSFLSFADLGIRESSSVFLLKKMGYSEVVGFNSAIFLFLFNLAIPSIIGLYFLNKKKSGLSSK